LVLWNGMSSLFAASFAAPIAGNVSVDQEEGVSRCRMMAPVRLLGAIKRLDMALPGSAAFAVSVG
jgi:hypothetical protein